MAQSFSLKKYLSKIHTHELLGTLANKHGAQLFFDINDQTPRKLAIQLMEDSIKSLETSVRLAFTQDLSLVASITGAHTASLGKKLFEDMKGVDFEPEVECATDADVILYFFLYHEDITEKLAMLFPFYASKSYLSYEAKKVDASEVDMKLTELHREFTRLANKDDNATEQDMEHITLDGILYIDSKFQGSYDVGSKVNAATGDIDKKHITRKIESVRIAYLPDEEVVLIAGTISKAQKLLFLETFLRVICGTGYEEKVEAYTMEPLTNLSFDFVPHNKGTPFIKAHIKSVTLSYAEGKKKLRLTMPSSREHNNLTALKDTLDELGLTERFGSFDIVNMTFGFMFQNKDNPEKGVNVSCSLSPAKATLCPLFEYERYAKKLLKHAGIYEGWKVVEK